VVDCYFDKTMEAPQIIRLHFVRRSAGAAKIIPSVLAFKAMGEI